MELKITTNKQREFIDITDKLNSIIKENGIEKGFIILQSLHTTSALTINEGYDKDVELDLLNKMKKLTQSNYYRHLEGNSDAHLSVSLFSPSLTILIENNKLLLGNWQRVFLVEFDGPRQRRIALSLISQ